MERLEKFSKRQKKGVIKVGKRKRWTNGENHGGVGERQKKKE